MNVNVWIVVSNVSCWSSPICDAQSKDEANLIAHDSTLLGLFLEGCMIIRNNHDALLKIAII